MEGMGMRYLKIELLGFLFSAVFCVSNAAAIDLYGYGSYWNKQDADGTWGAAASRN